MSATRKLILIFSHLIKWIVSTVRTQVAPVERICPPFLKYGHAGSVNLLLGVAVFWAQIWT